MVILYSYAKKAHGYLTDFQASVFSFITATSVIFPASFWQEARTLDFYFDMTFFIGIELIVRERKFG